MTKPVARFGVDWDDDLLICIEALPTDALNRMHTGISSDEGLVNLHWYGVNKSGITAAVASYTQEQTAYGLRLLHCVTGTNTTDGAYFGRTGSTNDFNVTNATTYTAVFWIRATVGSGTSFTIAMQNSTGSSTFTISSTWQKVTRTFTTTGTTTAFKIAKDTSATNVTFDATGFMIVAGSSAPNGFNVGHATNLYDNITADVKNYSATIGKGKWDDKFIADGHANLTLDNVSKRYSPEYSASPLFGYMSSRRRFVAEVQTSVGVYTRRFTGWAVNFAPDPEPTNGKRESRMTCHQGKFLLDRAKFNNTLTGDFTADQVIERVLMNGYQSAATGLQTTLNRSQLNKSYLTGAVNIMTLDTGISTLPADGADNWVDAPATSVLESVLVVDQGFLFIDAHGMFIYHNRDHYFDPAYGVTPIAINLDSEVQSSQYVYGAGYANTVRTDYYPPSQRVDTLWEARDAIKVDRRGNRIVNVKFEYPEGKKLNVRGIAPFGSGTADSTISAVRGTVDVSAHVSANFELRGGGGKLTLYNNNVVPAYFSVSLMGTISESYGGRKVTVVDPDGLTGGQILTTVSSKILNDEIPATNLANYLLGISKQNVGQFLSIQMVNKSNAALDKMLALGLGSAVMLSETQTAHDDKDYYVCGVQDSWAADSIMSTTMTLSPLFRIPAPWIMGASILGTSTILGY